VHSVRKPKLRAGKRRPHWKDCTASWLSYFTTERETISLSQLAKVKGCSDA